MIIDKIISIINSNEDNLIKNLFNKNKDLLNYYIFKTHH